MREVGRLFILACVASLVFAAGASANPSVPMSPATKSLPGLPCSVTATFTLSASARTLTYGGRVSCAAAWTRRRSTSFLRSTTSSTASRCGSASRVGLFAVIQLKRAYGEAVDAAIIRSFDITPRLVGDRHRPRDRPDRQRPAHQGRTPSPIRGSPTGHKSPAGGRSRRASGAGATAPAGAGAGSAAAAAEVRPCARAEASGSPEAAVWPAVRRRRRPR